MKTTREIGEQLQRITSSFKKSINYNQGSPDKDNEKIIILGNSGVGKTAFVTQMMQENHFPSEHVPSNILTVSPYTFQVQHFEGQYCLTLIKNINFYEIIGSIDKQINFKRIFNKAKLFIIFISASDTIENKVKQIVEWQDFIRNNLNNENCKIILVENKIDDEKFKPLSAEHVEELKKKFTVYKAISVKNKTNFSELKEIIDKELAALDLQMNADKEAWKNNIVLCSDKPKLNNIDSTLNHLNNDQTNIILKSMERLLSSGTTLNHRKAYNLSLFGGGVVHNALPKQKVPTYISNMHQIISYNVAPDSPSIRHAKLKLILRESLTAAKYDHFTRRQNTQVFYEKTIPTFLKRVSTPENLQIVKDINDINVQQARKLLWLLKEKLLSGAENNKELPYKIGFLGGIVYEEGKLKIKVPHHVAAWLTRLNQINNSSDCKLIIQELFHDILAAGSSYNSSRNNATQNFYQSILPQWIKDNLTKDLTPGVSVSPWVSLVCE